jgi:hypothetical protein
MTQSAELMVTAAEIYEALAVTQKAARSWARRRCPVGRDGGITEIPA